MKKTRFGLVVIALALLMSNNIFAQVNFDVPQNIKLKSDNDYAKYEPDIIAAAKWLEQTDLNVELYLSGFQNIYRGFMIKMQNCY